jgi:hypothetical protein
MKIASVTLALTALITGIVAAIYWYRSSKLQVVPMWSTLPTGELFEPLDRQDSQSGWIVGMLQSLSASADLNAKAALWTAASVVFSAISSVLSAL